MDYPRRVGIWVFVALVWVAASARAETPATGPAEETRFTRFSGDGRNGGVLETSDIAYTNAAGASVRLVAAVHIGEGSYYKALNESFAACDAVLYELIKPKGAPPAVAGQGGDSAISRLQT